jgi:hypothetical protein
VNLIPSRHHTLVPGARRSLARVRPTRHLWEKNARAVLARTIHSFIGSLVFGGHAGHTTLHYVCQTEHDDRGIMSGICLTSESMHNGDELYLGWGETVLAHWVYWGTYCGTRNLGFRPEDALEVVDGGPS